MNLFLVADKASFQFTPPNVLVGVNTLFSYINSTNAADIVLQERKR